MSNSKRISKRIKTISINSLYRQMLPEINRLKEEYKKKGFNPNRLYLKGKIFKI